ncbi:glycosyltransferase family 2 protein [Streptococcus merionis]|uniref:glycosyltransferase family 2 protein n=1 Tax=Streptococcus merionis TaxID=400065 RepID=UPI0026E95CE4|nr:glycosyltransferase family 2 protein [Streptococcus merionis]
MSALVSLIVPIYNEERYIEKCLDSLLNQTYDNFELLLINDGSTDRSGFICDRRAEKDHRIRVFHKAHEGKAAANNFGLDRIKGEYVGFVTGHDWVDEHYLESLVAALLEHQAEIAISGYIRFSDERSTFLFFDTLATESGLLSKETLLERVYAQSQPVEETITASWGKLFKASLFEHVRFPSGREDSDQFTTYKLYLLAKTITYAKSNQYISRQKSDTPPRQFLCHLSMPWKRRFSF